VFVIQKKSTGSFIWKISNKTSDIYFSKDLNKPALIFLSKASAFDKIRQLELIRQEFKILKIKLSLAYDLEEEEEKEDSILKITKCTAKFLKKGF
jgi:hypothetical protein